MALDVPWNSVVQRLGDIAEGGVPSLSEDRRDQILSGIGLIDELSLTQLGDRLYMAEFVLQDSEAAREVMADVLKQQPFVHGLLETLWPVGSVPVSGAVNMLKRLTRHPDEQHARRWLSVLNNAGLIAYNRNNPKMRVLFNPAALAPPAEDEEREQQSAHLLSRDAPFGNLLALRDILRAARGSIRWWEQHMPPKVLEVLYRELDGEKVNSVRLLSGPANVTQDAKEDFKRFRTEMKKLRRIDVEWRVLTVQAAREHHDRFFITDGFSRNLPPLNTILAGSTGEVLPSNVTAADFDRWWSGGTDIVQFPVPQTGR